MGCLKCEPAEYSYSEKPFLPPGGDSCQETFICSCGQKWWQFNTYYHLWSKVKDDKTFLNILNGCPEPVIVGNISKNLL